MRLLSRDFTNTEKVLILILCLILLALGYYRFVDQPVRQDVAAANAERDALEIELAAVRERVSRLREMRDELDRLGSLESVSYMGSYNNSQAELAELDRILLSADDYSVAFAGVTRDGEQIRRNFTLQFTTGSYADAKRIMTQLTQSGQRCLLGDVRYTAAEQSVTVNTTATFFETMRGGTPDSGLPAESAK